MKLLEHYSSVQGEGPNVGELTQFVRFAGCNFRCPGWPCDTQFAIEPSLYRGQYKKVSPAELFGLIQDEAAATGAMRVCLTGGEPLMQGIELEHLVDIIKLDGDHSIDLFTNGSFPIPVCFDWPGATVVMDWKLKGSGETNKETLGSRAINAAKVLQKKDAVKYVIGSEEDFAEALTFSVALKLQGMRAQEYAGVVWDKLDESTLVEWMMDAGVPWKLNVQMHNYIWDPQERGR